jgi:PAS domain S-box-containing protein
MSDDMRRETNTQRELRILRDYVHLLADAIDKSPMPFAASYPDGRTMAFNEAFADLTGYSEDELRQMQWILYLTPQEWQEKEANALEDLRKTAKAQSYEKEFLKKDGTRVPVEMTICQVVDAENKVQYYYTLVKNLVEKKRWEGAEQELRSFADRSWQVVDASSDAMVFARDGMVVDVNGAFT